MKITRVEAMMYINANERLKHIEQLYEEEKAELYGMIHPTRTSVDYDIGVIFAESCNPIEFAIRSCEIDEKYKENIKAIKSQVEVFESIKKHLSDDELKDINNFRTIRKVQKLLSDIVPAKENITESMLEHDAQVDNMTDDELLEGYEDYIERENIIERCLELREVHDMTYKQISEKLSITRERAKRIIKQHEVIA